MGVDWVYLCSDGALAGKEECHQKDGGTVAPYSQLVSAGGVACV